jgi:uncharacterized protein (TIGR02453 family)
MFSKGPAGASQNRRGMAKKPASAQSFNGFSTDAIRFLRDLDKHNDRAWFAARKEIYERELLEPLGALLADATAAMRKAKLPLAADPRVSRFRIYRDIRFSPDKRPYKTYVGAYLSPPGGGKLAPGGFYVHIDPKEPFMAVAFYQLDNEQLARWRNALAKNPKRFQTMLKALERGGVKISETHVALKRMPRGFEAHADSPIAKYFRYGSFMVSEPLKIKDVSNKGLIAMMVSLAKKARPLLNYGASLD